MHEYGILGADKGGMTSYHGCPECSRPVAWALRDGAANGLFGQTTGPSRSIIPDDPEADVRRQGAEPLFAAQDIKRLRPDCALLTPWDAKVYRDVN